MTMGLNDFRFYLGNIARRLDESRYRGHSHRQIGPRCYSRTLSVLAFELCLVALDSSRMNLTNHPFIQSLCQLLLDGRQRRIKAKHYLQNKPGDSTNKYNQSSQCRTELGNRRSLETPLTTKPVNS